MFLTNKPHFFSPTTATLLRLNIKAPAVLALLGNAFCRVVLVGKKAISLPSNLVQRAWFLIPNSPISHSVVHVFIAPEMRLLSPDNA